MTLTRVATAPVLVADLAKATGERLEVSPLLARDVLMVCVENARPAEVMGRLALAATASWEPIEGGFRLVPDSGARAKEASEERRRRLQSMLDGQRSKKLLLAKAAAAKASRAANPKGKPDEDEDDEAVEQATDPFVPLLDFSVLAALEPGDRVVFASDPTPVQHALRGDVAAVVQKWIADHNQNLAEGLPDVDDDSDARSAILTEPARDRLRRMSRPITVAPAKVIVVASREGALFDDSSDVSLQVCAYAADGSLLLSDEGSIGSEAGEALDAMDKADKNPTADDEKEAPKGTPIDYSPEAKAFLSLTSENRIVNRAEGGTKLPPIVHDRMLHPDRLEPLALFPGEGLAALAKARRKPLVGCLPDAAYPMMSNGASMTIEEVDEELKSGPMVLVPDATFLVVKPTEANAARRDRIDRSALAHLMQSSDEQGSASLDDMAAFAASSPPPSQNMLEMWNLAIASSSLFGFLANPTSWNALRLYAALNSTQRQSLQSGASVPFSSLSPAARTAIAAMLYGAWGSLAIDRPGAPADSDPFSAMMNQAIGFGGNDARTEPTQAVPNGLSAEGYLLAAVAAEPLVRLTDAERPIPYNFGIDELAMMRLMASTSRSDEAGSAMKMPDTGVLGSRKSWRMRGYVASGVYVSATLNDDHIPRDGKPISLTNLPPDIQSLVDARVERIKNSPFGKMLSRRGEITEPSKAKP